jgi:pilus assembly protein FimV
VTTPSAVPSAAPASAAGNPPAASIGGTDDDLFDGMLMPMLALVAILLLVALLLWRRWHKAVPAAVVLTPKSNLQPQKAGAEPKPAASPEPPALSGAKTAPSFDAGAALPAAVALDAGLKKRGIDTLLSEGDDDFSAVSPSEARPLNLSVDASDPVAEADFHLAYGLYDEAAALLKRAIAKDPPRAALHTKLAETYFAAKKPLEFQEAAETMQFRIPAEDWKKVCVMGQQLCPDSALFKTPTSVDPALASIPRMASPRVEPLQLPEIPPAAALAAIEPGEPPATVGLIDFDEALHRQPDAPSAASASSRAAEGLDLAPFDLEPRPSATDRSRTIEFSLDDADFPPPEPDSFATDFGDEAGTKLDLARAYSDMGDNEAARSLLQEVLTDGSAAQKQEAEALLKRLSA